jgi:hypothetical protein
MNLNKYHRQAIVLAIIQDIPRPALRAAEARAQKIIDEDIAATLPKSIAAAWKDGKARAWLDLDSHHATELMVPARHIRELGLSVVCPQTQRWTCYALSEAARPEYNALLQAAVDEYAAVETASSALAAALGGVRTRKAFIEQFPEFEKYAPSETGKGSLLPAIANVVADLSRLGWPKDAEAA